MQSYALKNSSLNGGGDFLKLSCPHLLKILAMALILVNMFQPSPSSLAYCHKVPVPAFGLVCCRSLIDVFTMDIFKSTAKRTGGLGLGTDR